MLRNVYVYTSYKISKKVIHRIIKLLKDDNGLKIINLEISIVDISSIVELNKKYLNHNYATDVISLNYSESSSIIDGEIFISYNVAEENAKKYRVSFDDELKRLLIHGILHLIGYDDGTPALRKKMKLKEDFYVKKAKILGSLIYG
ncbi:rRNA maturation RNase YbeY [Melioribacter sp. OK-6-Me]|uniref:rRNA maturation RNase YbeY n=1 Tax=unclassified Melioribacter TaxID=2627329 RepID=UPI003ED97867